MNTDTGHIVRHLDDLKENMQTEYDPIPDELKQSADDALGDADETHIDMNSDHPLAKWARKKTGRDKPLPKHPAFDRSGSP